MEDPIKKPFPHNILRTKPLAHSNEYRIKTFVRRLDKLGITVTFAANHPWIYFDTINGKEVTGTFHGNHGWTAFFSPVDVQGKVKFSDRREVFKKVRSML